MNNPIDFRLISWPIEKPMSSKGDFSWEVVVTLPPK